MGAGGNAFPTADTFRGAGNLPHGKRHGTRLFTGVAGGAALLFPVDLHQAEPIEPAVDRPQRAQVLAERAVHLYGQHHKKQQDPQLPEKQTARLTPQRVVGSQQGEGAEKRAGGAEKLAKRGHPGISAEQKQGANSHQKNQHHIFSVFQNAVPGQALFLFENRDFM